MFWQMLLKIGNQRWLNTLLVGISQESSTPSEEEHSNMVILTESTRRHCGQLVNSMMVLYASPCTLISEGTSWAARLRRAIHV
jgi:hypothetical protein